LSPILVRPVREQLEHDRIIRQLQAKFRRRFDVAINPGAEQNAAVGVAPTALYPDLVLSSLERGRRLQVVVEVETGESVNHLEALAQWAHLARTRAAFHLYVPAGMVDVARRLSEDNQIYVAEIWSYHSVGDEIRFTLVHRSREAPPTLRATALAKATAVKPAAGKAPTVKTPAVKTPVVKKAVPRRPVTAPARRKPAARAKPARKMKRK
jgi:hypothetical protein